MLALRHLFKGFRIEYCKKRKTFELFNNRLSYSTKECDAKQFRVSVDGNIASGKSTILNFFKRYPGTITIEEPVDLWRNVSNHNLLELLYSDLSGRNFLFENYVQLCRLKLQTKKYPFDVQFVERSIQNNRYVFIEAARQDKLLSAPEYVVLCKWYDWISSNMDISLDLIVYLQCSPEVAYKRMLSRGRSEEKSSIPFKYMKKIHESYEAWLVNQTVQHTPMPPVLVINSEKNLSELEELCDKAKDILLGKQKLSKPVTPIHLAI